MTCPFCGRPDDSYGGNHLERHKIEYIRDISKYLASVSESLVTLTDLLDARLPEMNWKTDKTLLEPAPENSPDGDAPK